MYFSRSVLFHRAGEVNSKVGWNGRGGGGMEHWKVLSANMVGKKNFRILDALEWLKQSYFDLGDRLLVVSALKPFLFSRCLPFFFCYSKKWGSMVPPSPPVSSALFHMKTRVYFKYFVHNCVYLSPSIFKLDLFENFGNSKSFSTVLI